MGGTLAPIEGATLERFEIKGHWSGSSTIGITEVTENSCRDLPGVPQTHRIKQKKARSLARSGPLCITAGSDLLSHTVSRAVPSAVAGLTSVFGMGTGVTLLL